jgi:3-hydroxy-9,10-secoandrosta-1,3,5(10)-triene-9,17-dione monooxygenase
LATVVGNPLSGASDVNLNVTAGEPSYPLPAAEPNLAPAVLLERAIALRGLLREQQDEADERGAYSPEMHQAFVKAGFYRVTQPRMFGGYEFELGTNYRLIVEISRGHPAAGWCLSLGGSHAYVVGSHWPEQAQRELFGADGHFIAPHRPATMGTLKPVDGGYILNGRWNYCSGIPYATHLLCGAMVGSAAGQQDGGARQVVVPRAAFEIVDDWGGDRTLGMRASGSNSAIVRDAFVPKHMAVRLDWLGAKPDGMENGTPGTRLHGNPMYLGRMMGPYHCSLVSVVVGAAWAALDEFETMMLRNRSLADPTLLWADHPDYLRPFGLALSMTEAAETILHGVADKYMDFCRRWQRDLTPISVEDNLRLWALAQQAGGLARQAVELLFQNSLSAPTKKGSRLERYFRDVAMYNSHVSALQHNQATYVARAHFGRPSGFRGL